MIEPMLVHARAPVRVDLAGGWTDVPRFARVQGGVVTNVALAHYVHVECRLGGGAIRLHAEDLQEHLTLRSPAELRYDGQLDLHKAALNMFPVTGGIEVLTRADVPPGSGLGASGALDVALVAALVRARGERYDRQELAELGFELEADELGLEGGRQDQYSAALGGCLELAFRDDEVTVSHIELSAEAVTELAGMLVIAYTGQSHFSSQTHERVWRAFDEGRTETVEALGTLRDLGREAAASVRTGDWKQLASVVNENWRQQQRLDATISTPAVQRVEEAARAAHAWAVKATGAGAGGCLAILAPPDAVDAIRAAVSGVGAAVLPTAFDFAGVQVSEDARALGTRA